MSSWPRSLLTHLVSAVVLVLMFSSANAFAQQKEPPVKLGVDVLIETNFAPLAGKRVGLITNPTGVTSDLRSTIDVLQAAKNVELVALFGPEHGVRGDYAAGDQVSDARDARTGVPVYSLFGKHRKADPEMLKGLDTLVFDIQDIGSRSYTFISTMILAMEAAAENDITFVVLDRPNPLGGEKIEGRPLDPRFSSFVGQVPIPYVHGMTVGELAQMANGEGWLADGAKCKLVVVPMEGWQRSMWYDETGLEWIPTSPHIPHAETCPYYAATGIMGELQILSEGVGYTLPFELAGAPGIDSEKLADELNRRRLPGVFFRPTYFKPFYFRFEGETCGGVQVIFRDRRKAEITEVQFHILDAVHRVNPDQPIFTGKRDKMFDKVCGTDEIRNAWQEGTPLIDILALWREGRDTFRTTRAKYLLYK